jgi:hypothetical protein
VVESGESVSIELVGGAFDGLLLRVDPLQEKVTLFSTIGEDSKSLLYDQKKKKQPWKYQRTDEINNENIIFKWDKKTYPIK